MEHIPLGSIQEGEGAQEGFIHEWNEVGMAFAVSSLAWYICDT